MPDRILIVNAGPPGDVARSTVIHRAIRGEMHWLTSRGCLPLLQSERVSTTYCIYDPRDMKRLYAQDFDRIISLNEESRVLEATRLLRGDRWTGMYLEGGIARYTEDSRDWFDMSLSSRLGRKAADLLKKENMRSLPQLLVEMVGGQWNRQEYDIGTGRRKGAGIGLISTNTGLWPNKAWTGYNALKRMLGQQARFLPMRPTLKRHIADINACETVVCGDTLGMHIALALRKKVVALFSCTSPFEIYGYNRLRKVISPQLDRYFYRKTNDAAAQDAIIVRDVYEEVMECLK